MENGRQVSGEITRIASQAFKKPRLNTASLPPVMAMRASTTAHHPERLADGVIGRRASGRYGVSGANHARFERDPARGRVLHGARDGQRVYARNIIAIKIDEPFVLGTLAAHAAASDDRGVFAQLFGPFDAGLGDRLARRDYAELRKPIEQPDFFFFEMPGCIETPNFRAVLKSKQPAIDRLKGPDARLPGDERPPKLTTVMPQRGDDAGARHHHAALHVRP